VQSAARALPGRLLFVSDANVWVLERGQSRRLTPDRISRQPSWSHDGQKIALVKVYTSGSDLWIMDADGTNSQELTDFSYRPEAQQSYALRPAWLPDGAGLLYVSEQGSQDPQLWLLSLDDRRRRRFLAPLGDGAGGIDAPTFSPDGATLAVTRFQPGQGPASRSQIWLWSMPGGPWRQVTQSPEGAYDPGWSPDGQRLAFAVRNAGRHDLWIARADGSGARQVTTAGVCRAPAWSPDGTWLAYLSAQGGTFDVWAVPVGPETGAPTGADGPAFGPSGAARQITKGGVVDAGSGLAWA
jgi:TolB protein